MKVALYCTNKRTKEFFKEVLVLESSVFTSPQQVFEAYRDILEAANPDIEVACGVELHETERGSFLC